MDGSDGLTDLRMRMPEDTGAFVRSSPKADGSMLLLGARCPVFPRPVQCALIIRYALLPRDACAVLA